MREVTTHETQLLRSLLERLDDAQEATRDRYVDAVAQARAAFEARVARGGGLQGDTGARRHNGGQHL